MILEQSPLSWYNLSSSYFLYGVLWICHWFVLDSLLCFELHVMGLGLLIRFDVSSFAIGWVLLRWLVSKSSCLKQSHEMNDRIVRLMDGDEKMNECL